MNTHPPGPRTPHSLEPSHQDTFAPDFVEFRDSVLKEPLVAVRLEVLVHQLGEDWMGRWCLLLETENDRFSRVGG